MVVMDSFALPVEGTETRVNAQAQGYEYMTAYIESAKQVAINYDLHFTWFQPGSLCKVGRLENAIGWYHSHPGYGCWLSGIDVSTQMLNQNFQVHTFILDLLHRTCGTFIFTDITTSVRIHLWRSSSIQSERSLRAKSTLEPSEPIPRGTSLQTIPHQSIRQFP